MVLTRIPTRILKENKMKSILVLVSALVMTTSAYAMPNVGDEATFAVTSTQAGQTQTGTLQMMLMSQNVSADTWSEQVTTTIAGQSSVQTSDVPSEQLMSDAEAQALLANCAAANGTAQTITVPAGTFNTCELPADDASAGTSGNVWVGEAIFGIIQEDLTSTSGQHIVMQLQSTIAGQ
jgi:hypothetical protein